jgi:mannose-1-phosphate guanylyltransferase
MSKKLRPIVLAGGIGKRLWPLSTESRPKQFIPIFKDLSLFDLTLQRINNSLFKKPIIVTSERYLKQIQDSFERTGLKPFLIVLEPESKNTFPPIIAASILSNKEIKDEKFIVMPSDHYISNNQNFYKTCKKTLKTNKEKLFLFGVKPEYPSQEYGYISQLKDKIEFTEKPSIEKAKRLFKQRNIFWNSGIFIFGKDWILNESKEIDSINFKKINEATKKGVKLGNLFYLKDSNFTKIKPISFDKGFVEKCNDISMFSLDAGWTDLGSWVSLRALEENQLPSIYEDTVDTKIERPWGFFQILLETSTTKLKLIKVMPKQKLSLQKHKFRSERWHVIKGRAKVVRDNEKFTLELGDTIEIEKSQTHSLENVEDNPLEIVEIQTGEYLGEDDIIRLDDIYGRADLH